MREILFRGKRLDNGEWVEGAYFKHDTVRVCLSSDDPKPKHLIVKDGFCDWGFEPGIIGIEVDPATVGQYTGLTANGKKIFEGDVLMWDECEWGSPHNELVAWDYDLFAMRQNDWCEFCLVIGNIHDNPELLEVDNAT